MLPLVEPWIGLAEIVAVVQANATCKAMLEILILGEFFKEQAIDVKSWAAALTVGYPMPCYSNDLYGIHARITSIYLTFQKVVPVTRRAFVLYLS